MFPFPRMMVYGTEKGDGRVLDIDFRNQALDSTEVVDIKGHVFSTYGAPAANKVVSTEVGNAMNFTGTSIFRTPIVEDIALAQKDFTLNVMFRPNATGEQIVFMTGDYYSAATIVGGFELILYNNTGTQVFALDGVGQYVRLVFALVAGWNEVQVSYKHKTQMMTVLNKTNSSTTTLKVTDGIGNGSYFCLGGSNTRVNGTTLASGFKGDLLYLNVKIDE